MIKKNIAVLGGGNSSEYEVSVNSAKNVKDWIDAERYNVYLIGMKGLCWEVLIGDQKYNIDKNDFSFSLDNQKVTFDCAIIIIHGTPGENGILQSYFELLQIPYNTCDVLTSAITFNKEVCKAFLKPYGITMAEGILIRKTDDVNIANIGSTIGYPCFVKPNASGSSCGVSKVKSADELQKAINIAFEESDEVLIEAFIEGTEITNGVAIIGNKTFTMPVTEIVANNEFFDYQAKYKGKSEEITPARISDELTKKCKETSLKIYKILNCKGIVRIDYIIKNNELYFLEVNTVPGMSAQSIIPQQIQAMGMTVTEMYNILIEDILTKNN